MIPSPTLPNKPAIEANAMIYLFLDVDDVITRKCYSSFKEIPKTLEEFHGATDYFDTRSVKNLDGIIEGIEKTGQIGIVICSTWRTGFDVEELKTIFRKHRFSEKIIGKTIDSNLFSPAERQEYCIQALHENKSHRCRAAEIQKYLKEHPEIIDYVICDDTDDHLSFMFGHRYIEVNPTYLITEGIKNYLLGHLFRDSVHPEIVKQIGDRQKERAEKVIIYEEGAPKIMDFYPYWIGIECQEVNRLVATDLSQLWVYFLNREIQLSRPPQSPADSASTPTDIQESITDQQLETYKSFFFHKVFDYLEKKKKERPTLPLDTSVFNEALTSASIGSYQRDRFTSPCKLNLTVYREADGVQITLHMEYQRQPNQKRWFWLT